MAKYLLYFLKVAITLTIMIAIFLHPKL